MNLAVNSPWALSGLLLALLPLFNSGMRTSPAPWLTLMPGNKLSVFVVCCLRLCAMAAIAGLVLGMAGLHRTEQRIERIGHGAHIVLLLDRSSSMDNTFAGRAPNGSDESKATAARRLLTDFVKQTAKRFDRGRGIQHFAVIRDAADRKQKRGASGDCRDRDTGAGFYPCQQRLRDGHIVF